MYRAVYNDRTLLAESPSRSGIDQDVETLLPHIVAASEIRLFAGRRRLIGTWRRIGTVPQTGAALWRFYFPPRKHK